MEMFELETFKNKNLETQIPKQNGDDRGKSY